METKLSVVVVCKNEAAVIPRLLDSVQAITDDIVVYDSGSTDATIAIAQQYKNVRLYRGPWQGFGKTKQQATALAKWDWILSLDADEALNDALQQQLMQRQLDDPRVVYSLRFKNFLGNKQLHWGEWGFAPRLRLFHRAYVNWDDAPVHERLLFSTPVQFKTLDGYVLHHTVPDMAVYSGKVTAYALLSAEKYFAGGKKATFLKRHIAPRFTFIKFYIFQLGFLDGWAGYVCARMTAYYTFLKYARLRELHKLSNLKT